MTGLPFYLQRNYSFMERFFISLLLGVFCFGVFSCETQEKGDNLEGIITSVEQKFIPDKRIAIFNVAAEKANNGSFVLKGETDQKKAYGFLLDTLGRMNVSVVDSIRFLPEAQLGEKVWALVTLSVIPMRKEPRYSAEMVSQTIMGTPVKLLDKRGGWYQIQTPDQYIGWVSGSGISEFTQAEMDNWKAADRYIFTKVTGSAMAEAKENAAPISDLVLGCIFEVDGKMNGFLKVHFPDGREGFVRETDCIKFSEWEAETPEAGSIIETAERLLGSPYLWGGTSTKGVDCSGFTKTSYFSQGIMLARDASQQALYGEKLDISNFNFQLGDLLFFGRSKEHITHVGLYMGDGKFIHSSGRVKINSFNPEDDNFEAGRKKQLVAASRVLNSLNKGQIILIKDHPWYN